MASMENETLSPFPQPMSRTSADQSPTTPAPKTAGDPAASETGITVKRASGEVLFREGDTSDLAFLVMEGEVEIYRQTDSGPMILSTLNAGKMFGEMGLLDGSRRSASARAASDVTLIAFDTDSFYSYLNEAQSFTLPMLRQMAQRMRHLQAWVDVGATTTDAAAIEEAPPEEAAQPRKHGLLSRRRARETLRDFQPDIVEIERRPVPPFMGIALAAITALLAGAIAWAYYSHVEIVVTASGRLTTTVGNQVLQSLDRAIIRSIEVSPGDRVKAGDLLLRLDATEADADVNAVRSNHATLRARIARLEAELVGIRPDEFSDDESLNAVEREIFDRRQERLNSQFAVFEADRLTQQARIDAGERDLAALRAQIDVLRKLVGIRRQLFGRKVGSRVTLLEAQNRLQEVRRQEGLVQNRSEEARTAIISIVAQKNAYLADLRAKAAEQLLAARREFAGVQEQLVKLSSRLERVEILAPRDAVVLSLAKSTIGAVVLEGEELVTLVPTDVPLEVSAFLLPKDISKVAVGDPVKVKLEALPFQKHGMIEGRVRFVSADTTNEELPSGPAEVYKTSIAIEKVALRDLPAGTELGPGMIATSDIKVGRRRLITYFIYPVIRTLNTGLREP